MVRSTASLGRGSLASCSSTVNVASEPSETTKVIPSYSPIFLIDSSASGVGEGAGVSSIFAVASAGRSVGAAVGVSWDGVLVGADVEVGAVVAVGSPEPPQAASSARVTDSAIAPIRSLYLVGIIWTVAFYLLNCLPSWEGWSQG